MSRAWRGGSTRASRKIRAYVMERDQGRCQLRLPGCTTIARQVHHKLGKGQPGAEDPRHQVAACMNCNNAVGDPRALDPRPTPRTAWR